VLDHCGRADVRFVRILAGVPPRSPLGEQIPALVESDRYLCEAGLLLVGQPGTDVRALDPVFLVRQPADLGDDVLVVHEELLSDTVTRADESLPGAIVTA
jgi:hypothetical protein